jgi:hypothetical protein
MKILPDTSGWPRGTSDVVLVHSSDVHVDNSPIEASDGAAGLQAVLATARALGADFVLLAGDTFENNQLSAAVLDRARELLAEAGRPIVILPGNHDPALPDSVFVRHGVARIPNVSILGVTHDEAVAFPAHDLEIWGHAHRDYFDMAPLRGPRSRSTRWQVAMAHGHYEPPETRAIRCARPGFSATRKSPPPGPTIWRSVTGTGRRASATASCRRFIRAHRSLPAPSIWFAWTSAGSLLRARL